MAAIRIALDTSILRRDPRLRSGAMEALSRFAESGYVEILVPDVVAREFTSLPTDKAQAVAGLRRALADLRRGTPEDFAPTIARFEEDVAEEFRRIDAEAEARFAAWAERTRAKLIPTGDGHAARVFAKYFEGQLPFKTRKSRADFPDAFIVESLLDLGANGDLLVVTADARMADALRAAETITVFADLKTMIESANFDDVRSEVEASNVPHALAFVKDHFSIFDDDVEKGVSALLAGTTVRYFSSWDAEERRGESLFIERIDRIVEWSLDTDGAEYLGEGVVSMSFGATVEVELEQPSDAGQYYYDEYVAPSPMEALLEVVGTCSLVLRREDLIDPAAAARIDDLMEHSRVEVDSLDEVTIERTDRERW